MADEAEIQGDIRDQLLVLQGRVRALVEAANVLDDAVADMVRAEEVPQTAESVEHVQGLIEDRARAQSAIERAASRLQILARDASRELAAVKATHYPGQNFDA